MPLSEDEQRLFTEIEQALAAEDPRFALPGESLGPKTTRTRKAVALITIIAGLACIVLGLTIGTALSTVVGAGGFIMIFAGTWLAIRPWLTAASRRSY